MTKKKELSPELKAECDAAKALFISRKNALGLTQAKLAEAAEISPAGVAMYLNGVNPLNAKFATVLSRLIGEPVEKFSRRLAAEIAAMVAVADHIKPLREQDDSPSNAVLIDAETHKQLGSANMSALLRLKGKATPRSLDVLKRIEKAALEGRLKEADLLALEGIAARFEQLNTQKP